MKLISIFNDLQNKVLYLIAINAICCKSTIVNNNGLCDPCGKNNKSLIINQYNKYKYAD